MKIQNKELKRRIIEISYRHKLSHLGSCLTAVDIIKDIYDTKKPDEKFVLSQGHAGLALYIILEKKYGYTAESLLEVCGIHPDRLVAESCIDCSTGSLGQGLPIALGMALADRTKNVYCLISDGELSEGSIYEAFNVMKKLCVENLKVFINYNGYGGYGEAINPYDLFAGEYPNPGIFEFLARVVEADVNYLPFVAGLKGHYHIMSESDYLQAMEILK